MRRLVTDAGRGGAGGHPVSGGGARARAGQTHVLVAGGPRTKWAYDRMIKVFEQRNPGIKVEFMPFRQTEYNTILSSALTGGKGPDIIHLRAYGGLETFAAPGVPRPARLR